MTLACGMAGAAPATAAVTSSAVASGSYGGDVIRSGEARMALAVQPASPAISLLLDGTYDDGDGTPGKSVGDAVGYSLAVRNAGDVGIEGVAVTLALSQGDETFSLAAAPQLEEGDEANPGTLDLGETWRFSARYPVEFGNLERPEPLVARASASGLGTGDSVEGRARAAVELPPLQNIAPRLISLSHVPSTTETGRGSLVDYTITISNRSDSMLAARLSGELGSDIVPAADGTAGEGEGTDPFSEGPGFDFGTVRIASSASMTIRYSGRLTDDAATGFHVNSAILQDPATGIALIPPSKATVQTGFAPPAGCSPVAIEVFDDENRDGRADADEPGLSGVRVSADGSDPLTTDPSGRFASPCVAVSRLAGIELRLELDEGTLPDGYFVTTENPVTMRLGRGETASVSFGAAPARIVRLDLNSAAFQRNSVTPDSEMTDGLTRLISVLGRQPSILRVTYYAHNETVDLAEQRLAAVRRTVLDYWVASDGNYDLKIDARIVLNDS